MLTPEQSRILAYLQKHFIATLEDMARCCWPGASRELLKRALADLEWLGYVIVYDDPVAELVTVQSTERGRRWA